MIYDAYDDYDKYLSDGAKLIVENDPRLFMNFLYAVWNGPGYFQQFSNAVNTAYANGDRSPQSYWNIVQAARRAKGGLIAVGADKLDALAKQLPQSGGGSSFFPWLVAGALAALFLYSATSKKRKSK